MPITREELRAISLRYDADLNGLEAISQYFFTAEELTICIEEAATHFMTTGLNAVLSAAGVSPRAFLPAYALAILNLIYGGKNALRP
jgi:hypothetical protein